MEGLKGWRLFTIILFCGVLNYSLGLYLGRKGALSASKGYPGVLNSTLEHPDTAICYWDRGALYILFVKPHAVVDSTEYVNEEDQ